MAARRWSKRRRLRAGAHLELLKVAPFAVVRRGLLRRRVVVVVIVIVIVVPAAVVRLRHKVLRVAFGESRACDTHDSFVSLRATHLAA